MLRRLLLLALVVTACGTPSSDAGGEIADLPEVGADEFDSHLASLGRPAVVNVWASWCLPCRSEAPLLERASAVHGEKVEFIGVDVADNQADAKRFLTDFDLDGYDHFFDPDREIPARYGGFGTPITFFFAPGGELLLTHDGIIDERTLALNIDELLRLGS